MMPREHAKKPEAVRALFDKLMQERMHNFPRVGERWGVPAKAGVYIVYCSKGEVCYVGQGNLRSRLGSHLRYSEIVSRRFGKGLRKNGSFRFLMVDDERDRLYLEGLATGCLCPTGVGMRFAVA